MRTDPKTPEKFSIKRSLLIAAGSLSFGLGVAGIFLPLLPTTPFLLLASFCFLRSSKRLHGWLVNHRLFGKYLRDYLEHRSIPRNVKISTLAFLWISIILTMFIVGKWYLTVLLAGIATAVSVHILSLRTRPTP